MKRNQDQAASMLDVRCWMFDVAFTLLLFLPSATSTFAAVRYMDVNSTSPSPPYTNWASAAATIQVAVDAAAPGDEIVVTNGTYATGGRAVGTNLLANRVAVDKPIALRSVNGPQFTIIQGYQVPAPPTATARTSLRSSRPTSSDSPGLWTATATASPAWTWGLTSSIRIGLSPPSK